MPLESLAIAAPVIFLAYAVFGMTGFGAAMVAVPLLVQFMPLQFAVPLVVLFDLACTALVGGSNWRRVSLVELKRLDEAKASKVPGKQLQAWLEQAASEFVAATDSSSI